MSAPVTEIQWSRRTHFERVATRNMVEVHFSALCYQVLHCFHIAGCQQLSVLLQPFEKHLIFYERHLDRFGNARAPFSQCKRGEKMKIIEHCRRRGKCAEEVFFGSVVDTVFYAYSRIVLR